MTSRTEGKHAWTARIGDKGQLVIPKEAREIFDIKPGDTVLLLGDTARGLAIVSNEELLNFAGAVFAAQLDTQTVDPE
ncbi:AbrB/MazE/SpoVT family DNA-binding domain-containing protein [Microbacterium aerolatum]|uniref:AbrB family transcriptional regulator n=1 Tax=Microbacterium aerolatum TaxID=153731 RepID=A0A511AHE4_9MICO|nr:AbrB/MazE/SpoVT family DNA-binding domain-containing protein [Microbacterium aerolatum]GEK87446.1 AbrB family transcriptional regulator [Microbacterium aerolatum]GGB33618.1 AbrB family transcriptional regulator [Microbacterium aerolatum]